MVLKKKRGLLLAIFVILVAVAMITSGTVALFNSKVTITSHFEAGTLEADLDRIGHEKMVLGDDGYMHKTVVAMGSEEIAANSLINVFDFAEDDLIVPLCEQKATFRIKNNGNVVFDLLIQLMVHDGSQDNKSSDAALLSQLSVTVELVDANGAVLLDGEDPIRITRAGNELAQNTKFELPDFAANSTSYFRVSVLFVDDDAYNNNAMAQHAYFDLIVNAVQSTTVKVDQ